MTVRLHFYGAAGCVTGSCILLETERAKVLIDCGMFQGSKTLKELNYRPFPFEPGDIDTALLTHAHIDHSGLLPKLALEGFSGPIFATAGTRDLCSVLLPDSGAIQEAEVDQLNRRNRRRARPVVRPIFTASDARDTMPLFSSIELETWREVAPGVRARWWNAGHILGSASIEVEVKDATDEPPLRLCFSGDLGPGGRDLADDPEGPSGVDHLIIESTYGDVERRPIGADERRRILAGELRAAHAAGGPLLIPAFAVERTQELVVDLLDLMEQTAAPPGPIFIDSPLAIKATDVFLKQGRLESGENPFKSLRESRLLRFSESRSESRDLEWQKGWHVIVAASGMCDAGRVRNHLRRLLPRNDATVLIVGYQPVGTLGRLLLDGLRDVRIQGDEITVRARIRETDVYSGHADADGLVRWASARRPVAGSTFLTHGEPRNLAGLKARLMKAGFAEDRVAIAALDQSYALGRAGAARAERHAPPRMPPDRVARLDWHNSRVSFLSALQRALDGASDDAARETLLARLTTLLPQTAQATQDEPPA
jgi:metallo-beta-lactamase family protein